MTSNANTAATTGVPPLLLSVNEAARVLQIGRSKLYELLAAGELPVVRIGRSVRIPTAALEQWVQRRTSAPLATV